MARHKVIVAEFLNPEAAKKKKRKKVHAKKAFTAYLTVAIVWAAMFIASVILGLCLPNRPLTSAWALTGVGILNLALVCFVSFAEVAGWSHYAVFWYDRTEELARTVDAARRKKDLANHRLEIGILAGLIGVLGIVSLIVGLVRLAALG